MTHKIPLAVPPFHLCTFLAALAVSIVGVSAQTTNWTGSGDGTSWSDTGNWSTGALPNTSQQTRFLNNPPDAAIVINVDSSTPVRDVNFATAGTSRTLTFNGGPLYLEGDTSITWNASAGATTTLPIVFNSGINFSSATAATATTFSVSLSSVYHPITFNGNITTSGTGARQMTIGGTNVVTINGSNASSFLTFGGTGELIAGSTSALGAGAVHKTSDSILSLRSDVTVTGAGSTYSWLQNTTAKIRINEASPGGTANRTITMDSRIAGTGTLTFIDNVNSTGKLILELKYSGGTAQSVNLVTNDSAIVRFAQTGNTTYSSVISGTGQVEKTAGTGTTTLSGANTYTGNTVVSSGTLLLAATTGKLNFLIGADGINNQITGTSSGNVTLNGAFTFDLTGAGTSLGDSWQIVDLASLGTVTFGGTFAVEGFTEDTPGLWTSGSYQFNTGNGVLSVIPEPTAAMLLGSFGLTVLCLRRRRK